MSATKFNTTSYTEYLKTFRPSIIPLDEYKNIVTKIKHKCLDCGNIWETQPRQVLNGKECRHCFVIRFAKKTDVFKSELHNINPEYELIGEYKNAYTPTDFEHNCGFVMSTRPDRMLRGKIECRNCNTNVLNNISNWGKPVSNTVGDFPSKLEADCGLYLITKFGKNDVIRYKLYDNTTLRTADFYIISLDTWIEVSSITKQWYIDRIERKKESVEKFIFATSLSDLQSQI